MKYDKNDQVTVNTQTGTTSGIVKDRFIQNTKLESEGRIFEAKATAENPVYLVEFADGKKDLISEKAISMEKPHTV